MPIIKQIDKPPKGIPKEGWKKYKAEYFWNVAKVAIKDDDAYIVMIGAGMKRMVFVIPNYASTSEVEIENELSKSFDFDGPYPLGRHFHDCLGWLREQGLKGGYIRTL